MKPNNIEKTKADNSIERVFPSKDPNFWKEEIQNAGVNVESSDFVTLGKMPPSSGYELKLGNIVLDEKNVDVYRSGDELYLHVKE